MQLNVNVNSVQVTEMSKVDPNEAPEGYVAVDVCAPCTFYNKPECHNYKCFDQERKDGQDVIFKNKEEEK